jgi:hypothetical protein
VATNEQNIDSTANGTGLFNTKIPGLSDAADIQAALRLYHYGRYDYDGANTDPEELPIPSIANHLQNLKTGKISFSYANVDAFPAAALNGGYIAHAISTGKLYFAHGGSWIPLTDESYVISEITDAINNTTGAYSDLAGSGIEWNSVNTRFDLDPILLNSNTVITKTSSFTLDPLDANKTIFLQTSSPMNLTVPANSAVNIPIGYKYNLVEIGSGRTTFVPASGVTVGSKNSQLFLDGQYSKGTLVKTGTDSWV